MSRSRETSCAKNSCQQKKRVNNFSIKSTVKRTKIEVKSCIFNNLNHELWLQFAFLNFILKSSLESECSVNITALFATFTLEWWHQVSEKVVAFCCTPLQRRNNNKNIHLLLVFYFLQLELRARNWFLKPQTLP